MKSDSLLANVKHVEKQGPYAVRDRLMYCEVLESQLTENKKLTKNQSEKSIFSRAVAGKIIKKYKYVGRIKSLVSEYYQRKTSGINKIIVPRKKLKSEAFRKKVEEAVCKFLEKDENSSIAPGIRDTITKNGITKEKDSWLIQFSIYTVNT